MRVKSLKLSTSIALNHKRLEKAVFTALSTIWKRSAAAFIKTAAEHTRVDTGMSLASLLSLAGKVTPFGSGATSYIKSRIASEGSGKKKQIPAANLIKYGFASNVAEFRSATFGQRLGKDIGNSVTLGARTSKQMSFSFKYTVFQHWKWGERDALREASVSAFKDTFRDEVRSSKLPSKLAATLLRGTRK